MREEIVDRTTDRLLIRNARIITENSIVEGDLLAEGGRIAAFGAVSDDGMSITDVAAAAGFSGASYYGELFKRTTGTSPGEYRRRLRESTAPP
jgi:AraC-like DNA-binding protein